LKTFVTELEEHQVMIASLAEQSDAIEAAGALLIATLKQGGKILLCGNGGSAADCQHIAAELMVRYEKKRHAMAAIALTTDSSILTAHANDCLIAISTSGTSKNILKATEAAKAKGMTVIGLTGNEGGELSKQATLAVVVPSKVTARIQEAHILIGHWWCGVIEEALSDCSNA